MIIRQLAVAAAAALSVNATFAIGAYDPDLGTDPFKEIVIGAVAMGGNKYDFTFDLVTKTGIIGELEYFGAPATITSISVLKDGAPLSSAVFAPNPNSGSFSFLGLGTGSFTLSISGSAAPYSVFVGSVTAVPEAETYALALAGLGVVGLVAARRRKAQ